VPAVIVHRDDDVVQGPVRIYRQARHLGGAVVGCGIPAEPSIWFDQQGGYRGQGSSSLRRRLDHRDVRVASARPSSPDCPQHRDLRILFELTGKGACLSRWGDPCQVPLPPGTGPVPGAALAGLLRR
jgi:hypothetical protein